MNIKYYYLILINLAAFLLYALDKKKAQKGTYRISEATLIGIAAIGGSVGAWIAMQTCRHKTQKPKFYIGVPVIFILQAILVIILHFR